MGFFGEFNAWLTGILNAYIGQTLAVIAGILEPVIVTLGVLYVIVWGYLQLTGRIEEPFIEGAKRLLTLGVVLGLSLQLWLYNDVFVDTFFNAPTELAASIIAARNPGGPAFQPVAVVDEIFFDGDDAATLLMEKGEIFGRDIVLLLRRARDLPDRRAHRRLHHVPARDEPHRAGRAARHGADLPRTAVLRLQQTVLRGLARAAQQLRVPRGPDDPCGGADAAGDLHGRGVGGRGWRGHRHRQCAAGLRGRGAHVPDHAAGAVDGAGHGERHRAVGLRCRRQSAAHGHGRGSLGSREDGGVLPGRIPGPGQEPLGQHDAQSRPATHRRPHGPREASAPEHTEVRVIAMPRIKATVALALSAVMAGLVTGCSTQARRVDCDGRLRPINAPVPVSAPAAVNPAREQTP
ncbi:MAG: type IV secretion system protein [Gammaproteobacteria bacterium]|nr:type IV secretion system protein [Gammaproteobacteria bacterium]